MHYMSLPFKKVWVGGNKRIIYELKEIPSPETLATHVVLVLRCYTCNMNKSICSLGIDDKDHTLNQTIDLKEECNCNAVEKM